MKRIYLDLIARLLTQFIQISGSEFNRGKKDSAFYVKAFTNGMSNLRIHPKIGASWEGFALEEVVRLYQASSADCYFWSTYSGAEIDLLIIQKNKKIGFEFKFSDAPSITKSMQIALIDLKLDELNVIYPGDVNYALSEKIQVKSLKSFFIQNKLKIDL
jgi:predicted AAA+ superfamily ATPase